MTSELYDTIIKLGFEFVNYPPKINEAEPLFIRMKYKDYNFYIDKHKLYDYHNGLSNLIEELVNKVVRFTRESKTSRAEQTLLLIKNILQDRND